MLIVSCLSRRRVLGGQNHQCGMKMSSSTVSDNKTVIPFFKHVVGRGMLDKYPWVSVTLLFQLGFPTDNQSEPAEGQVSAATNNVQLFTP